MAISSDGYEVGRVDGRVRRMHRVIVEQVIGRVLEPDEVVHHRNGDKLDNRPENLQVVSRYEHAQIHRRSHCQRGHDLTDEANVYRRPDTNAPICRICMYERNRYWNSKR